MIGFFRACVNTMAPIQSADSWLNTPRQVERLGKALKAAGAGLVLVEPNPIDTIWRDRAPLGKITLHPCKLAGEDAGVEFQRLV
jgi:Xaa-Pro aminopeptidase